MREFLKFIVATAVFTSLTTAEEGVTDEIDKMVNEIKEKRESKMSKEEFLKLPSPLMKVKTVDKNLTAVSKGGLVFNDSNSSATPIIEDFTLKAILNRRAFINDRWYKIGDEIGGYKLAKINGESVLLESGDKSKELFFHKKRDDKIQIIGGKR
jgi:hypothetical protein